MSSSLPGETPDRGDVLDALSQAHDRHARHGLELAHRLAVTAPERQVSAHGQPTASTENAAAVRSAQRV